MPRFRALLYRLDGLFRRGAHDAEMNAEMQAHLDGLTERNLAAGMSPADARHAAQRTFGGVSQIAERARDERRSLWIEQLGQDLRYAVRMLRKTPGFTATVVLTLALGLGVNAALFAVYDFVIVRPLPSRQPEELVDIRPHNEQLAGRLGMRFSYPDYLDYCAGTQAFSDLVAVTETNVYLSDQAAGELSSLPESGGGVVSLQAVSGNYFSTLGAQIILGRDFRPEEAYLHSGQPVMVVSHLFWKTHLHGAAGLGTTLTTRDLSNQRDPTTYTIIGVTAPNFLGQSAITPAGWIPLTAHPEELRDRARPFVQLIGRMKAGISSPQAKTDLDATARRLSELYPEERRPNSVLLTPGMKLVNVALSPQLLLAMSPVLLGFALTLVIACLNVANLLLARGVTRQHEIGVRLALGASRGRIVRQLLAENVVLCVMGAGAALLFAVWTLQILRPILLSLLAASPEAQNYVSLIEIGLDRHLLGFGALLAVVAGFTAGLVPALHSVRRDGVSALKQEGSAFGRKLTPSRLRGLLLVGQVAVCLTLLTVSGLMTGKLLKIDLSESGLSVDGVYRMRAADVGGAKTSLTTDRLGAIETLRTLRGVVAACWVSETPLGKPGDNFGAVSVTVGNGNPARHAYTLVSAGFFETLGVPVLRGRAFTPREVAIGAPVVVVSETDAQELWPGEEAVGQVLSVDVATLNGRAGRAGGVPDQTFRDYEVIGVARGIRGNWSQHDRKQLLWFPFPTKGGSGNIFVRLQADSTARLRDVERMMAAGDVPLEFQESLEKIVSRSLWPQRMFAWFSGVLSGLALVMATVGLYGIMSFGVNQRVKEIGVRMALGATAERVTGLIVRQGMRLVAWGGVMGLVGGAGFSVLLTKAMPGAGFAGDLALRCLVFAVVTSLLVMVALIACWLPARRATKVDPMVALRVE